MIAFLRLATILVVAVMAVYVISDIASRWPA